jgi:N-acetylmuramoyl-L-alanine amidase
MRTISALFVAALLGAAVEPAVAQTTVSRVFTTWQSREQTARRALDAGKPEATVRRDVSRIVAGYESLVGRFPRSAYSDNALWQAAILAADAYARYRVEADRQTAVRLLTRMAREYPTSSLIRKSRPALERLQAEAPKATEAEPLRTATPPAPVKPSPAPAVVTPVLATDGSQVRSPQPTAAPVARITAIRRTVLPDVTRIAIEIDREIEYTYDRIEGPVRVFLDLSATQPAPGMTPATVFDDDAAVRGIRLGPRPESGTRVVLDLAGAGRHSVFNLYGPYRIVVDIDRREGRSDVVAALDTAAGRPAVIKARSTAAVPASAPAVRASAVPRPEVEPVVERVAIPAEETVRMTPPLPAEESTAPLPSRAAAPTAPPAAPPAPSAPSANAAGRFSLSRQLGLGISRIVIDPGHGGHDPGAKSRGLSEAELVLDVALRLEKLLAREPGVEVVMTRRTNVFIPLEERTAIANREGADLFLSIHANASRNSKARGVETYFLNFASTPDAEAVAARENSASGQTMHKLPDIVKAITLNNKLDESRDFATLVQREMVRHLARSNSQVRDLGVKQAPFVVLIGAGMPSVLAEISFVTHPQEGRLLKGGAYRQRIAEALFQGIQRYQRSLKAVTAVATTTQN